MLLRNKKTGEIIDLEQWRFEYYKGSGCITITNDKNQNEQFCYGEFADMKNDWEDYAPKEPLIKDEKIRKAVRAWAEACGAKQIKYSVAPNQYYDADMGTGFSIKFLTKPVEVYLEDGKTYTIAELCGEGE